MASTGGKWSKVFLLIALALLIFFLFENLAAPQSRAGEPNTYEVVFEGTAISHPSVIGVYKWEVSVDRNYGSQPLGSTVWVIVGGPVTPGSIVGWVDSRIAVGDRVNVEGLYDPNTLTVTLFGKATYNMRLVAKKQTPEPTPKPTPNPTPKPTPVTNQPPSVIELKSDKQSPQNPNSIIEWTASASDPDVGDTIYYKFMINNNATNNQWQDLTDWRVLNSWTWSPGESDSGTNYIGVAVRDGNHASQNDYDDFKQSEFTITQSNQPPKLTDLSPDLASPQKVGSAITWKAFASDPDNGDTIFYKFMINNNATNSQWKDTRGWDTLNQWTWVPTGSDKGETYVGVAVRDGKHAAQDDYDDFKEINYTLGQPNQPPKVTGLSSDLKSPQIGGSSIVWTATSHYVM